MTMTKTVLFVPLCVYVYMLYVYFDWNILSYPH